MDYNYGTDVAYSQTSSPLAGVFAGVSLLIYVVILIAVFAGMWKTFAKAGKPGWAALIPIYNIYVLLKIVGRPGWWLILCLIPLVNVITLIIVYLDLAKSFGRSTLFGIFVLILFSPIGLMILGFGKSEYTAPKTQ